MGKSNEANKIKAKRKEKQEIMDDLTKQFEAGERSMNEKLEQAKDQLLSQLRTVAEKYMTVNGYMAARHKIREAGFGDDVDSPMTTASDLAREASRTAADLADAIEKIDVADLDDSVLDGLLADEFVSQKFDQVFVARQLLVVELLQNVGPSIQDIMSFRGSTQEAQAKLTEEMEHVTAELAELPEEPTLSLVSDEKVN